MLVIVTVSLFYSEIFCSNYLWTCLFFVFCQGINDIEISEVVEKTLVAESDGSVTFRFEAPCEGIAVFIWENRHDWWSNKKITYSVVVDEVCLVCFFLIYQ